ncbi:MAG: hypothetical protein MSH33_04910 [Fusobacterium necrophorum]|nr:hypothetical protein [Fusobacterium necrophorum]
MAEVIEKTYLDHAGVEHLVEKLGTREDTKDAATLKSAKAYADGLATNYDPAGTAQTKVDELANGQVKTNKEAIERLNGADTVDGSVAKQIKDAKDALEKKITDSQYDDSVLSGRVTAVEGDITTLKGTGEGSVKKQIDDALNDFATKVSDDQVVNTYKELIDYAAAHKGEAATMAGDISKNAAAIKTLETYVGKLPEGTDAASVIDYINKKVASVDFSGAIATAKQEAIDAAAADASTKSGKALEDAKAYSDGLAKNYATAAQGAKADTAVQTIASGTTNGTIAVDGTDVAVNGLGSAAYEARTAFEVAGAAKALADGQVATNKADIAGLKTKVESLESVNYVAITTEQIDAMFA